VGDPDTIPSWECSMSSTGDHGASAEGQLEGLRTNARLLSLIYDNTSDPVYLVSVDGGGHYRFLSVNESFLRVTGYRVGQVVNAPMERVVPSANVGLVRSQYERAIATRQPVVYEERAELPAGIRYAEITLIPIFEGSGPVTHILADIRDVTVSTTVEMERAQLLSNAVFLSDATRLLASLDIEHALADVARLAVPYLGDGCAVDLFDDRGPRRVVAIAREPRRPMLVEIHPTVLGGHTLGYRMGSTHCLGVPLLIKGQATGAITLRADRDRKYSSIDVGLVEELARRAAMAIDNARLYRNAEEALRTRDEFLMVAAHEIRGPVTSIHLTVQALLQKRLSPDATSRAFEIIEREDRRLSRFVDELLDLGRLRAGRLRLQLEDVNLTDVVQGVAKQLGADLATSGSSLTISAQPSVIGEWDTFRLEQIVTHLLSNAIKFGLGKPIEISVSTSDARARLTIRDNGIGIDPPARERIFMPFERNVPAHHYGGLGLGLHIVKTLVDAMGGSVTVASADGAGSTFVIELPLHSTEPADAHPHH
jgi:PAS domain S-box-containing protein